MDHTFPIYSFHATTCISNWTSWHRQFKFDNHEFRETHNVSEVNLYETYIETCRRETLYVNIVNSSVNSNKQVVRLNPNAEI